MHSEFAAVANPESENTHDFEDEDDSTVVLLVADLEISMGQDRQEVSAQFIIILNYSLYFTPLSAKNANHS
jgi:hypothetical protein